jgi:1-acylglycerone phosphate reductase
LAPFSVKVITVFTGGVESMIARTDRQLQSDSLYLPIEQDYLRRVKHSQEGAMPSDDYAKSVVGKVLKLEPPAFIWEGNRAWVIWAVDTFFWRTFMDRILIKMFNLVKLAHIPHRLQEKKDQ